MESKGLAFMSRQWMAVQLAPEFREGSGVGIRCDPERARLPSKG